MIILASVSVADRVREEGLLTADQRERYLSVQAATRPSRFAVCIDKPVDLRAWQQMCGP